MVSEQGSSKRPDRGSSGSHTSGDSANTVAAEHPAADTPRAANRPGSGAATAGTGSAASGDSGGVAIGGPDGAAPTYDAFDYRQLHLEVSGKAEGEPILLLHGWGSSARNMQVIARALESEYRIYNVDLPGHGQSPAPPEAMGVPEHAEIVGDLIRNETNTPVTIIGHSNGGRIALYMASDEKYKSLIRRLLLVSPSGITPKRSASYYVKRTTSRILKAPFEILPEPLREFGLDWLRHSLVWRALGSSDYRALEGTMRETFVRTVTHHVDDRVAKIDVPTLLVWGDRDTAVSRRQMEILEDRIPDSGLLVLENAGHYGYIDDFDTFIGGTRYFLQNS